MTNKKQAVGEKLYKYESNSLSLSLLYALTTVPIYIGYRGYGLYNITLQSYNRSQAERVKPRRSV